MGRIISFDYGRARIGISHSDERKIIASPLCVCARQKNLEKTFQEIQNKLSRLQPIDLLLIGYPLLLNGKEGEMAQEARAFAEALASHLQLPFKLWDERLSTMQAERLLKESNMRRKERSNHIDTVCSTLILQNYLESLSKQGAFLERNSQ